MNPNHHYPFVILGAGITGVAAATVLKQHSPQPVLLIHHEDRLPYKRTQLNKSIATGFTPDRFALHPARWYADQGIQLLAQTAVSIDPVQKQIHFENHPPVSFQKLLLATGSAPRSLGHPLWDEWAHRVHHASEAEKLIATFETRQHYTIVGAGAEGLETAFQLRAKGKQVVLLERHTHAAQSFFTPPIGQRIGMLLEMHGINFENETLLQQLSKQNETIEVTTSKRTFATDVLIACNGAVPRTGLASKAGIVCRKGILVNGHYQTSHSGIFAAGDVAEHAPGWCTGLWHAAERQGAQAAQAMLEIGTTEYRHEPFRLKTELAGQFFFSGGYHLPQELPENKMVASTPAQYREVYLRPDQTVQAILSVNEAHCAKGFQQALHENWTGEKLRETFPFAP